MRDARGRPFIRDYPGGTPQKGEAVSDARVTDTDPDLDSRSQNNSAIAFGWAFLAIVTLSVNLRPSITSLPPIFYWLTANAHLSSTELAILTGMPVLCFSAASAATPYLYSRYADWKLVTGSLAILFTSLLMRGLIPVLLLPLTAISAAAIGLIGTLIPGLIRRYQPIKTGALLAAYLVGLYGGAMLGGATAVPLYERTHSSLTTVLAIWATTAMLAIVVWLANARRLSAIPKSVATTHERRIIKFGLSWKIAGFMGAQSLMYYATLAWLPTLLNSRGLTLASAGIVASTTNAGGLAAAWVVPIIAHRFPVHRLLVALTVIATIAGILGVSLAPPSTALYWSLALGVAQGSAIGLALFFTIARTTTAAGAASLSSMSQCLGYALASLGPVLMDAVHAYANSWQVAFVFLSGLGLVELALGWSAAASARLPI